MMKFITSIQIFLLLSSSLYSQNSDSTIFKPLTINSSLTVDNIYNTTGGIKDGYATMGLFDINFTYTPSAQGVFRNTVFHAHILKTGGKAASENFIGDAQVASNIEGRASRFIYELYIGQQFKNINLSFGLHDLNTEFMASEYAGDYINSSFGISPSISLNVPVSIFPVTSIAGIISYNSESFDLATGIYNLNYDYLEEEEFNLKNHLFNKGYLGIIEMRYRIAPENNLNGEYKIGAYYKYCDSSEEQVCPGEKNKGAYFIADQTIWSSSNHYQLGMFTQISIAPKETNFVPDYYGLGISLKSSDKKIFPELIGLAVGSVGLNTFNDDYKVINTTRETTFEFSVKKELFKRITLQPDIQYIIKPSGIYNNSLVGILRLQIDLIK